MIKDYLKMAFDNLMHRKTRSWLTLIGIFIGITAVVALISLGQGLKYAVTAEFLELGADKMQISAKSQNFGSDQELANQLRDRDLHAVERTAGILRATTYVQRTSQVTWGKDQLAFYAIGGLQTEEESMKLMQDYFTLKIAEGRSLKPGDKYKAIIGSDLSDEKKLDVPLKVGDKVKINGTTFEIVGRYAEMGDPGIDNTIFVPIDTAKSMFNTGDRYDAFLAQVNPGEDTELVADEVTRSLRQERGLDEGDEDFSVQTPKDLVESFEKVFGIIEFVIYGIAFISLIVGGVGIMNTMYTAVLERTKEIGIMKAIGATNRTIMTLFLIESGMLGLLGGLIGLLTGIGLAKITEYIGKVVLGTDLLTALVPWWLIVGSLLFAFCVGVVSGVAPAYRASKQQAVDSIRYE